MKLSDRFLQTFTLILLFAFSSATEVDEGESDGVSLPKIIPHPELPDFAEGVTVSVLNRMESCVRQVNPGAGEWLELEFVAKQTGDDGDDEEFDSTESRGKSLLIAVDDEIKLPGLSEGLRQVCIGDKREITIQAGSPLLIVDPNSGLKQPQIDRAAVYVVTVRSIQDQTPTNLFAKMDVDNNKEISRDEAKNYFEPYGFEEAGSLDKEVDRLFQYQDKDRDNSISFEEFQGPKHSHDEF